MSGSWRRGGTCWATVVFGPWDVLGIVVGGGLAAAVIVVVALRALWAGRAGAPAGSDEHGGDTTPTAATTRRRFLEQGVVGVFAAALVGVVTSASDYLGTASRRRIFGPPPGIDTTGQRPAGPHCN